MRQLAYAVLGIGGIIALLVIGQSILIPFTYGVVLWYFSRYFKTLLHKVSFIKKQLPGWLTNVVVSLAIILILSLISQLITTNVNALLASYDMYEANIEVVIERLNNTFEIDLYENIEAKLKEFDYSGVIRGLADSLSGIFGNTIMIIIYAIFIISEEASFLTKRKKLFNKTADYERVSSMLARIDTSVSEYIRLKTYVSLLTGLVGYIFLSIMGVDAAFFWAFLMFALNYIPTIGSLIATIFPAVFSLIQFGEFAPFIIILGGLGVIEGIIGNVLEPKIMGSSLNLSPLVTILALVIWGQIWGITGMLLSVPITVVMVIIFSQFESTRQVAILLSENGDIDDEQ